MYYAKYKQTNKGVLYLCSTSINVGDKVIHNNPINQIRYGKELIVKEILPSGCYFMEEGGVYVNQELVKYLYEISPNAKWVNNGDKINEEDVKLSEYPKCPKCGAISNDGFCPEESDCEIKNKRIIVYVKGPCGHYH